jgi:hypothetical protein
MEAITVGSNREKDKLDPFFCPYRTGSESCSARVFNRMVAINEHTSRAMTGNKSQWDGRTKHIHIPAF